MEKYSIRKRDITTIQEQIGEYITSEIIAGKYKNGDKLPSLRELGKAFCVSHETVKYALDTLSKRGFIEIVPSRGAFVRIEKDRPISSQHFTFGVLIDLGTIRDITPLASSLYDRFIELFNNELPNHSHNLLTQYICFEKDKDRKTFFRLLEKIDGLFVVRLNNAHLRYYLKSIKKPVITLLPAVDPQEFDMVGIHEYDTYYSYTKELLEHGYSNPLYFDGYENFHDKSQRINAFLAACREFGVKNREDRVLFSKEYNLETYQARVKEWLEKHIPIDSIICVNDNFAVGAIKALREAGMSVPKDVVVIGGRNTALCFATSPTLSSIDYNYKKLVYLATKHMFQIIEGSHLISEPIKMLIKGNLIRRESYF